MGLATLMGCVAILFPFLCAAGVIMTIGVVCCMPIIVIALAGIAVPILLRQGRAAVGLAGQGLARANEFGRENPMLMAGIGLCALPLTPVILFCGALGTIGFFIFAPVTVPATAYIIWRWRQNGEEEAAIDARGGSVAFDAADAALPPTREDMYEDAPRGSTPPHSTTPMPHRRSPSPVVSPAEGGYKFWGGVRDSEYEFGDFSGGRSPVFRHSDDDGSDDDDAPLVATRPVPIAGTATRNDSNH